MGRIELPASLWEADSECLKLPPSVAAAYRQTLTHHGLLDEALKKRPEEAPVGGLTLEQSNLHFAHAFDGSVARAELALLDPHGHVPVTSTTLLRFLGGGTLCLVDVPCGAGAATLALLGSIFELRSAGVLPRMPLRVHVIGGEISAPARAYAEEQLQLLQMQLSSQAITLSFELSEWDVLCANSNSDLVERIVLNKHTSLQTLVMICNFNGFLERSNKKKEAEPQLNEIFRFSSGATNAVVWLEPQTKAATERLFPWLFQLLSKKWNPFARHTNNRETAEEAECSFQIPMKVPATAKVRLAVVPVDVSRQ